MKFYARPPMGGDRDGGGGRDGGRGRDGGGGGGGEDPLGLRRRMGKKRAPSFVAAPDFVFDYKDANTLRHFISERGKIVPRRISGLNATQQRQLTQQIKMARKIALLPYTNGK
jgi:small subunit ribosomal protein S18